MKPFYPIVFLLSTLVFLEGISRFFQAVFPYEDHQRYSVARIEDWKGRLRVLKINGRGAIGELYNGQKRQAAFFGTSSLLTPVPMKKAFPELLRRKAGGGRLHIDNYSFFGQTLETLIKKLNSLRRLSRRYDFSVVCLTNLLREGEAPGLQDSFRFQTRGISLYSQVKNRHKMKPFSPPALFFKKPLDFSVDSLMKEAAARPSLRKAIDGSAVFRFNFQVNQRRKEEASLLIDEIVRRLYDISDKIFWMTEPFAYSADMPASYRSVFRMLKSMPAGDQLLFMDIKSLGLYMAGAKDFVKKAVLQTKAYAEEDLVFIDLFQLMQKEIADNPGLFSDEFHLSEKGHETALQLAAPVFLQHIPDLFKD